MIYWSKVQTGHSMMAYLWCQLEQNSREYLSGLEYPKCLTRMSGTLADLARRSSNGMLGWLGLSISLQSQSLFLSMWSFYVVTACYHSGGAARLLSWQLRVPQSVEVEASGASWSLDTKLAEYHSSVWIQCGRSYTKDWISLEPSLDTIYHNHNIIIKLKNMDNNFLISANTQSACTCFSLFMS